MKHSSAASHAARSHDWPASIVARSSGKPPIAPKSPFTFVSERGAPFTVAGLQKMWSDVEFESATLHLRRAKGGATATHPLLGDELRALRALKREAKSPFIFVSERGAPFTVAGLQKMVERAGVEAKMPFKVHPHMLRHATGFALANKGTDTRTLQAYLGHRSIQSTVRYTELAPGRFKDLWR